MKNNRKFTRVFTLITMLIIALILLVSCDSINEEKQMEMKTISECVVDCIMKNDMEKAYTYMDESYISREDFYQIFPQIIDYVGEFKGYEIKGPVEFKVYSQNGTSATWLKYLVDTDNLDFYIEVGTVEDRALLSSCNVVLKEDADVISGNNFSNVVGKSPFQIIVLLLGFVGVGFAVWMLVDCVKKNVKKKVLWILVIIFGQLITSIAVYNGDFNIQWNIGLILAVSTLSMSENVLVLRFSLPLGAIVYSILRKKLIVKDIPVEAMAQEIPSQSNEESEKDDGREGM